MIKTILANLAILANCINFAHASNFCTGFQDGYVAGFCSDNLDLCAPPVPPVCPVPPVGMNTYQGGYSLGFQQAILDK